MSEPTSGPTVVRETGVSPWTRLTAVTTLFVYMTVLLSPGAHAAEQVVREAIDQSRSVRWQEETSHARAVDDATQELRSMRGQESRASAAQLSEDKLTVQRLRARLAQENQSATAEMEAFETQLRSWHVPEQILERHRDAVAKLRDDARRTDDDLARVESATRGTEVRAGIDEALAHLDNVPARKRHQKFEPGKMPYAPAALKARKPRLKSNELRAMLPQPAAPRVLLAASGSSLPSLLEAAAAGGSSPEYLSESEDVQITPDIRAMAAYLGNDPGAIYNWVHNNVQYLPTYGSIQGSQLTLLNQRGNAYDQASLLIAMFRAIGIPARYAYGTVEVPSEQMMNWLGVSSADQAQDLLGQGGIPNVAVTSGGKIKSLRFEHVWVEAWVDFYPSRGARNLVGDSWVPLDPSFKRYVVERGVEVNVPFDAAGAIQQLKQSSTIDERTGLLSNLNIAQIKQTFYDYESRYAAAVNTAHPGATSRDLIDHRSIEQVQAPILAATLPYKRLATGNTYAALPASLRHYVQISLYASAFDRSEGASQMTHVISLPRLGLQRLWVNYRPASAADASVIDNAVRSGAKSLPAYLIHVVPQLKLDDQVLVEGPGSTMGDPQTWEARLNGPIPSAVADVPFDHTVAGDVLVFSIDAAGVGGQAATARYANNIEVSAAEDLHFAGLTYWTAHNWTDRNSAEGVGGRIVRLPSVALLSDGFTPRYFFGIARQASYQGRVLDARHVTISAAAPTAQLRRALVLIAGIQGSQWEASALNNVFGRKERQGLSATEYLTYAASHNVPIQVIAQENLSAALASLSVSPDVKDDINAAVSTGKIAMIPQRDLNIRGHVGNGYIIVDPETGAGAYLIDGGLNGGLQEPCTGASASPPAAGGGGGGGGGGQSTMLVSLGFMPAGLPAPAEGVTTRIGSLVSSEANMARLAEIGAQAANDAEAFAPRLTPSVTFRLVSTGFVLVVGAAILTAVILAVAYSIAVLFTYHHAQIELALLAAEEGVDTQVEPVAPPQAEPNPDEKDCECEQNPESPQCRECTFVANCPHKGGDEIHNTCADFYTQPQYFGCDVKVTTPEGLEKNFDAMSPDGSLWEVKTRYLGGQNRSPFLAEMELNENYKDALYDSAIAKRCGRPYVFSVGDQPHYDALAGSPARPLIDILHKNQCLLSR